MHKFLNESGLSLVEVIVSTCVMGIVSVAVLNLLIANIKLNTNARDHIVATNIAENEMEKLKNNRDIVDMESESEHNGFTICSMVESLDKKDSKSKIDMYKIVVEVRKRDQLIERIETYKNSLRKVISDE